MPKNISFDEWEEIEQKIDKAIKLLFKNDYFLLEKDVNERSITHRLAEYLQKEFAGYHVDCEYNKMKDNGMEEDYIRKTLDLKIDDVRTNDVKARTVYPDIIIHTRGINKNNLLVIEVKKTTNKNKKAFDFDIKKVIAYTKQLKYAFGLFLEIGNNNAEIIYKLKWYKDGKEIF